MSIGKLETVDVINEIQDLQYDLQQWIRGEIDKDFSFISGRQAADLTVISSTGAYQSRLEFNKRYTVYYGKYKDALLSADIIRTKRLTGNLIVVAYKQLSVIDSKEMQRMTTAVFGFNAENKHNAEWKHVHVTLINNK